MTKDPNRLNTEILAARALSYRDHKEKSEQSLQDKVCLSFSICGQTCLLPLENIASLQSNPTLTTLPSSQKGHRGLFSARGAIHEVFCLNTIAGGDPPEETVIVTLQSPHHGLALGIEEIEGTQLVDPSKLLPLENDLGPPGASGITRDGAFFIQLTSLLTKIH